MVRDFTAFPNLPYFFWSDIKINSKIVVCSGTVDEIRNILILIQYQKVFVIYLSSNLKKQKFQLFPGGSEKSRYGQSTRVFDYKGTLLVDSLPFGQLILDENMLIIAHNVTQGRFLKLLKTFYLKFI